MAKLRIQAPDGKTLVVDVGDADPSEYDGLASSAVEDYTSTAPAAQPGMIARLSMPPQPTSVGEAASETMGAVHDIGNMTKAGYAGLGDIIAGNGLKKSVEDIKHVEKDEDPTSAASTIGEALGNQVTPGMLAIQATLGGLAELVGPAIASLLKGWGEKAALNAVGMIKSIASTLNVSLPDIAKFLVTPIEIGGKEFAPIVQATSDTSTMLSDAEAIQRAAGKQIEAIANTMDDAINGAITWAEENTENPDVILDLKAMKPAIEELKDKAVGGLEDVAPDVVQKFDGILKAVNKFSTQQDNGTMATSFSDLSALKTKLGGLTNFRSQTENNLAMQQAYGVIAKTLDRAAKTVGGDVGEEYANANAVYHQVTAVINALQGKETKFILKDLFAPGAGAVLGTFIGGLPGMAVGATAGAVGKTYGYQAIARGLNATSPLVAKGLELTAKGVPIVARAAYDAYNGYKAISDGLSSDSGQ